MKLIFTCFLILTMHYSNAASIFEDLTRAISNIQQGDSIVVSYHFVGCFGPYQKGEITLSRQGDEVLYKCKDYDSHSQNYVTQQGQYTRSTLLAKLQEQKLKSSEEIIGNAIHYQIHDQQKNLILKDHDQIDQKHFVQIFHPFSGFLDSPNLISKPGNKILKTPRIKQ